MNRQLTWSIVADGGTDRLLVPVIQWAIHRLDPDVEILEPEFRKRRGSVEESLGACSSGAMIIFVHRDSESLSLQDRLREFETVTRPNVVPVVPVRMSEAWIRFDGPAVARAAGSRDAEVPVPRVAEIEAYCSSSFLRVSYVKPGTASSACRTTALTVSAVSRRVAVGSSSAGASYLHLDP